MISRSALPRRPRRCPWRARALPPSTSPAPSCPMTTRAPRAPPPPRQPLVASPSRPVSSACRSGAQKVLPAPTWARSAPTPVSGNELENGRERERFAGRSRGVQNLPNLFPLLTKTSFFLIKNHPTGIPGLAHRARQLTGPPGPYRPAAEHTS